MSIKFGTYFVVALVVTLTLNSCRQLTHRSSLGDVVATVDEASLYSDEVRSAIPSYPVGDDSLDFAARYVERWIKRQVKVEEAERILSSSVQEVEMLVNAYRQALLTQRLDLYYVNTSGEMEIETSQIRRYYNQHNDNFRLDRHIVKGRILRLPLSYVGADKLKEMMSSSSEDSKLNLQSLSEKSGEFELDDFTEGWIDYTDFMSRLPIVRDSKSRVYMTRNGVQTVQDSEWSYLFEITAYRSAGYVAPIETVEERIRQILTADMHTQLIREREEALFQEACQQGKVYNSLDSDPRQRYRKSYDGVSSDKKE